MEQEAVRKKEPAMAVLSSSLHNAGKIWDKKITSKPLRAMNVHDWELERCMLGFMPSHPAAECLQVVTLA